MQPKPIIGILTWRQGSSFKESRYLRQLVREGQDLGATVFLFSASDIVQSKQTIRGYVPKTEGSGFRSKLYPWPDIVIDRCRNGNPQYKKVRNSKLFVYANNKYTNKWNATRLFMETESLRKWMPETVEYSRDHLRQMLSKHPILYIKPGNGTGGRSIIKLTTLNKSKGFSVIARTRRLAKMSAHYANEQLLTQALNRWVNQEKIRNGIFMIQKGLDLELIPNHVSDMRLLIQKDSKGVWTITGYGIRIGPKNSSTSNLHGGGRAAEFEKMISKRFGQEKMEEIREECFELAYQVVRTIERHFGSMMEFGLDIGIDTDGRVWLIEVNPKPGRDIFKGIDRMDLYRTACRRPLQYAIHLANQRKSGANGAG
ncbi:YheC/YheD family protein [Paenibacillus albiflavus]|uniref:YheC/YheD family protein n=1 Tax=Paenibacillus albiflavus TaxID=2545760 RepID=A0A4R4ER82_9BACL|nr:YheC/YheD family protein [Paenibacillus albiflavus]TCZ80928.1 YheC/YheD family protein [Paenibacillus albiflavus]